jgi:hypothetical protein
MGRSTTLARLITALDDSELHHAIEVAKRPEVVNQTSMARLYERIERSQPCLKTGRN